MRDWAFFANLLSNVEMTLAKTDMRIAGFYVSELVDPELQDVFDDHQGRARPDAAPGAALSPGDALLANNPLLRQTLEVREPLPGAAAPPAGARARRAPAGSTSPTPTCSGRCC